MRKTNSFVARLAPDTINRLERAAEIRSKDAKELLASQRLSGAVYILGFVTEMCLTAAYFRAAGFSADLPIDRDTRQRRMAQARQIKTASGEFLMNSDPHPLVGWAKFLEWQRLNSATLTAQERQRLAYAIRKAEIVYNYWRPELRYKTIDVKLPQVSEVFKASDWFLSQRGRL